VRSGLLSDLATVGYEIFLEGDHVKLRYRKSGSPPDTVRPLIDELRKYKAEVVNILKMGSTDATTEKSDSQSTVKALWPPDVQSLVDWFMIQGAPVEPFFLEPHLRVEDPGKFFESLRREIETGPIGPRARLGALQWDLRNLKAYLN
jgi:hypothetical protein